MLLAWARRELTLQGYFHAELRGLSQPLPSATAARAPSSSPSRPDRRVSGIADRFNGHIDEFHIAHVQRSDGWIATTWNNMSDPGAFAVAGAQGEEGGQPPLLASAGECQ